MRFHYLSASLLASWETAGTTASSRKTNFSNFCRDLGRVPDDDDGLQVWAPPANPWANGWAEGEELWHAVGLREDEWLIESTTPRDLAEGGYSEWMEKALGSWSSFLFDLYESNEQKHINFSALWRPRLRQLSSLITIGMRRPQLLDMYASAQLEHAVLGTYWLRKADTDNVKTSPHDSDLVSRIHASVGVHLMPLLQPCKLSSPCGCMFVSCREGGELWALDLWTKSEVEFDTTDWPSWSNVESLVVSDGLRAMLTAWPRLFPRLRTLRLELKSPFRLSDLNKVLEAWASTLIGLVIEFNAREGAHVLEAACRLHRLRRLKIMASISVLPKCFGKLSALLELDIKDTHFKLPESLPVELASMKSLVSFIAFGQGKKRNKCPVPRKGRIRAQESFCRSNPEETGDDQRWQCSWEGWRARLDYPSMPWWGWTSLERFWVDANFLTGTFAPELVTRWPHLRALDLHVNELTGTIPKELGSLQNLTLLQLKFNHFGGRLDIEALMSPGLVDVHLQGNRGLTGCLPRIMPGVQRSKGRWLNVKVFGTGIKRCVESRPQQELEGTLDDEHVGGARDHDEGGYRDTANRQRYSEF